MRGRAAWLVAAAMGLGAAFGGFAPQASQLVEKAAIRPKQPRGATLRAIFGGGDLAGRTSGRRAGYGWTHAHARRVAQKKRNQRRHRSAGRGRRRA